MSYGNYKQADSRWGKKNYNGSSNMANAGCGPTAVANLAYHVDGKTTPWDVAKYMQSHGYAIRNNGTAWAGIPAAMKAYGLTDVKNVAKMADVFSYIGKGYCAVFLMRAGSRGGICWTTAGHYISVTGYKLINGKHWFYTRDPGGRNHTGWYCYETQMKGLIPQVWIGKATPKAAVKKVTKPTGKYGGTIPSPTLKKKSTGAQVRYLQNFLNWYCGSKLSVDGIFGDKTAATLKLFQASEGIVVDGIYGKVSYGKANLYKKPVEKLKAPSTPAAAPAKTNAEKIANMAKACAWPAGTAKSKYSYPSGSATPEFKAAITKAYPDRSKWGAQTRAGASCDVFVGSVIRACGYDTSFPRGLDGVLKHMKGNSKWQLTGAKSQSQMKPGDVVFQLYKGGGGHIFIYLGNGMIANAHYNGKAYGIIQKLSTTRGASDCKTYNTYRAK